MSKGISKEEFNKLKPLCSCPEHEEIPWNDNYTKRGYPKYIFGHHPKGKPSNRKGKTMSEESRRKLSESQISKRKEPYKTTKEEFDRTAPHICKCGCNEEILWSWRYKYTGIPEYKHGHNAPTKGKPLSEEHCKKLSESHKGQIPWIKGKHHTEESKQKNSEKHIGIKQPLEIVKKRNLSNIGKHSIPKTEATKEKLRQYRGPKSGNWKGGTSYLPYCNKFTEEKKEEVRNKYERQCFICNLDEKDNITKTNKFQKLSVHHIDGDKEQGCNDKPWFMVPLCIHCHGRVTGNKYEEYWIKYIQELMKFYNIKEFMINNF